MVTYRFHDLLLDLHVWTDFVSFLTNPMSRLLTNSSREWTTNSSTVP
jgi:hypothetical protein